MTTIEFERVIRDCKANDRCNDPRFLIADYDVVIDGTVRATFSRNAGSKGYRLYAPDGFPITAEPMKWNEDPNWRIVSAETKSEFGSILAELLLAQRIPTPADVEQRIAGEARAREIAIELHVEAGRERVVKKHAMELYRHMIDDRRVNGAAAVAVGPLLAKIDAELAEHEAWVREACETGAISIWSLPS